MAVRSLTQSPVRVHPLVLVTALLALTAGFAASVADVSPAWWIAVYVHELGHAVVALVLRADSIVLEHHGQSGGVVTTTGLGGVALVMVALAGYLATAIAGAVGIWAALRTRTARWPCVVAAGGLALSVVLWADRGSVITWMVGGAFAAAFGLVAAFRWVIPRRLLLAGVAGICAGNFFAAMFLIASGAYNNQDTDLHAINDITGIPVPLVVIGCTAVGSLVVVAGLRAGLRRPTPEEDPPFEVAAGGFEVAAGGFAGFDSLP